MQRPPPISTRTGTLFPDTTLFRSTDWTAFNATGNTLVEFDTYGRSIRQKVRNDATDYQVVDTRYDMAGRVQCPMVRMNPANWARSAEHTSELPSLMRISYVVFCLKKKITDL